MMCIPEVALHPVTLEPEYKLFRELQTLGGRAFAVNAHHSMNNIFGVGQ